MFFPLIKDNGGRSAPPGSNRVKGGIVYILGYISSDICLILFDLRAVQSTASPPKKSTKCSQGRGGGFKGVLSNVKKTE